MRRLSIREGIAIWIGVAIASIIISIGGSHFLTDQLLPVLFSIESILLGFLGTIIIALPSILRNLGESQNVQNTRQFSDDMHDVYEMLEEGKSIKKGDEKYDTLMIYLIEHANQDFEGYDDAPNVISVLDGESSSDMITLDGETIWHTLQRIPLRMKHYSDRIDSAEEIEEDKQERRYVSLGCGVYGLAIIFQSLSTLIPNLSLL